MNAVGPNSAVHKVRACSIDRSVDLASGHGSHWRWHPIQWSNKHELLAYDCIEIHIISPDDDDDDGDTDVVIQLEESEDGSICCLDLAGDEVLSVAPNTDPQKIRARLRHKLAKKISPHANLHLINERGELLPEESNEERITNVMQSALQAENAMADDGNMRYEFRLHPLRPINIYSKRVTRRQPPPRWPNQLETVISLHYRFDRSLMNPDEL